MNAYPPITALMVTTGRLNLIEESYRCFSWQTYPNKYLTIVTDSAEAYTALEQMFGDQRVGFVYVEGPKKTLGELRNISIEAASDLSIQWDDDDWYGPTRMMDQYAALGTAKAVLLTEQLHYFRDTGGVAWNVDPTGIEGTILFDKRCGLRYPAQRAGEDTVLKQELIRLGLVNLVPGGACYCRTYHGSNTWERRHHEDRVRFLARAPKDVDRAALEESASLYGWKAGWKLLSR